MSGGRPADGAGGDLRHPGGGAVAVIDRARGPVAPFVVQHMPCRKREEHEGHAVEQRVHHDAADGAGGRRGSSAGRAPPAPTAANEHREAAAEHGPSARDELLVVEAADDPDAGDHRRRGVEAPARGRRGQVDREREGRARRRARAPRPETEVSFRLAAISPGPRPPRRGRDAAETRGPTPRVPGRPRHPTSLIWQFQAFVRAPLAPTPCARPACTFGRHRSMPRHRLRIGGGCALAAAAAGDPR